MTFYDINVALTYIIKYYCIHGNRVDRVTRTVMQTRTSIAKHLRNIWPRSVKIKNMNFSKLSKCPTQFKKKTTNIIHWTGWLAECQYKFGIIGRIVYCQTLYAVDRCRMLDTETALDRAVDTDLVSLIPSPTANWSEWAKQAILSVSIRSTESSVLSSMRSSLPHGCSSAELDAELDSDVKLK